MFSVLATTTLDVNPSATRSIVVVTDRAYELNPVA
jgi:hypothetical protein